ncbi:MAG: L,D-transpeptidase family protein [Verrucomicrobia bacterium]|nr:L,D-transpeptidase family protein [Verrucomicrobiota bacterium]
MPVLALVRSALVLPAALLLGACATAPRPSRPAAQLAGPTSPTASVPAVDPLAARDAQVRLQLLLDDADFGPGVVDGRDGEFTRKALARYNAVRGLPAEAQPDTAGVTPYTSYVVSADNLAKLGTMGKSNAEIQKQKGQPYTSLTELLAERFHTSRDFLRRLNPGVNLDTLAAGARVTVPNVARPFALEDLPLTRDLVAPGGRRVLVDLRQRMLEVREGARLLAAFPITPGSSAHPAPPGEWRILGVTTFPWFRWDEGVLKRGERTENFFQLPPGPNSPVGIMWAGLNKPGIGIHGSPNPETIGRAGSHGCIRLSNWDAAKFCRMVSTGAPVTIQ